MPKALPKAERVLEMQDTRVSVEPPTELLTTPPRRPYGPGDMIDGKYELESLLGNGGMGEVWTAKNATLGVRRAVKLIRSDAGNAESTDRLLHEAQAAARLNEPSIVRVFDFGKTAGGDPYIVMEMLEGEDLMSVINRRERLSPSKAVRVLLPMIRALSAAHAHGIVHRDLKPENIFLCKLADGRVEPKLLDFGIAKLKNARALRLTTAGAVMGSPLYMAPEQARGEDVDERADIWAVCVVLYEAITGSPPFGGDDRPQVLRAVADSQPKNLSEHGVADASLWPIISRGLEKVREDRWPSMQELGRALARWLLDAGVTDDITGASLEAAWFRSSRQSLFGSSLPPDRRFGRARRELERLWRRAQLELTDVRRGASQWLQATHRLDRRARWGVGVAVAVGALAFGAWVASAERQNEAARAGARSEPATALLTRPPLPEPPPLAVDTPSAETSDVPAALPSADTPASRRLPSRDTVRAPRKSTRALDTAPAELSKEHRRSKLIDPYQ